MKSMKRLVGAGGSKKKEKEASKPANFYDQDRDGDGDVDMRDTQIALGIKGLYTGEIMANPEGPTRTVVNPAHIGVTMEGRNMTDETGV